MVNTAADVCVVSFVVSSDVEFAVQENLKELSRHRRRDTLTADASGGADDDVADDAGGLIVSGVDVRSIVSAVSTATGDCGAEEAVGDESKECECGPQTPDQQLDAPDDDDGRGDIQFSLLSHSNVHTTWEVSWGITTSSFGTNECNNCNSRNNCYMRSVFPQEWISDYSYSQGGGTDLISDSGYSRDRDTGKDRKKR